MFRKFNEFLQTKAKIELVADFPGKVPNTPPQGKGASPYKQGSDCKQMTMKGEKDQEPLNDKKKKSGDVYTPKDLKVDPVDGKKLDSWPKSKDAPKPKAVKGKSKTKTEQFIEKTKGMSLAEFNSFMRERLNIEGPIPPVMAYNKGRTFPDPIEATRYVVAIAKANPAVMENLAHELRRQKATQKIVANLLDLPETYTYLSEILSDPIKGTSRLRNLSKKLMEIVGNPVGFEIPKMINKGMDNGETDDEEMDNDTDDEEMDDEGDEEETDEEMDDEGDEEEMDDEEMT